MCMTFCYNAQINFCYFFHSFDLVILRLKAFRHLISCERNSNYFPRIFLSSSEDVPVIRCNMDFLL